MKVLEKILDDTSDTAIAFFWQIIGPLFILCTFALAPDNRFIFFVGLIGIFLCARWQMLGFFYSLIALALASVAEHLFFDKHLWLLGIQGSYAMAFLITALNAERHTHFIQSLFSQLTASQSSILNLEDEFTKSRDSATSQQMMYQEKCAVLQSQMEEAQAEQSSLQILNEVLRKTAAREAGNSEVLRGEFIHAQTELSIVFEERNKLQNELNRLTNKESLVLENKHLLDEIHAIRLENEQMRQMHETSIHLHKNEKARAQEAFEQMVVLEQQKEQLVTQSTTLTKELELIRFQWEKALEDQAALQQLNETLIHLHKNENARAQAAFEQIVVLEQQKEQLATQSATLTKERDSIRYQWEKVLEEQAALQQFAQNLEDRNPESEEKILRLEEKVKELSQVESLFKQLKEQFAEKNHILHKTRSELFYTDTALEALKIDLSSRELSENPISEQMLSELVQMDETVSYLQRENEELENLVTMLSPPFAFDLAKRKKKVKVIAEQEYLF